MDIQAVIISEDSVSSAVLARTLKEWWRTEVRCGLYQSAQAALNAPFLDEADIVFIASTSDELELYKSIRAIYARAEHPCIVVTAVLDPLARSAALRAGADQCISRYVANEDDIHRCLWRVLRKRAASRLQVMSAFRQLASA